MVEHSTIQIRIVTESKSRFNNFINQPTLRCRGQFFECAVPFYGPFYVPDGHCESMFHRGTVPRWLLLTRIELFEFGGCYFDVVCNWFATTHHHHLNSYLIHGNRIYSHLEPFLNHFKTLQIFF